MPLVLNASPGDPAANSYATLEQGRAYHEGRGHNDQWKSATEDQQAQALVWATRLLDQENLRGEKTFFHGALRFPRSGLVNRDGHNVDSRVIPQVVVEAVSEWALHLLVEDRTADAGGLVEIGGAIGPIKNPMRIERSPMPASVREMLTGVLRAASNGNIVLGRS